MYALCTNCLPVRFRCSGWLLVGWPLNDQVLNLMNQAPCHASLYLTFSPCLATMPAGYELTDATVTYNFPCMALNGAVKNWCWMNRACTYITTSIASKYGHCSWNLDKQNCVHSAALQGTVRLNSLTALMAAWQNQLSNHIWNAFYLELQNL